MTPPLDFDEAIAELRAQPGFVPSLGYSVDPVLAADQRAADTASMARFLAMTNAEFEAWIEATPDWLED